MRTTFCAAVALAASLAGCKPKAVPTPAGTVVLEWRRTEATLANGLAIGATVGAPLTDTRTIDFTTDKESRDPSLRPAHLELTVEREDVQIVPNPAGQRPAELAALPKHVVVKVLDPGDWRFDKATCQPPGWPTDIDERLHRVGVFMLCELPMAGGRDDVAHVTITVAGNGKHTVMGEFGKATLR